MYDYVPFNENNNIIKHGKSVSINFSCINHQNKVCSYTCMLQNKSEK